MNGNERRVESVQVKSRNNLRVNNNPKNLVLGRTEEGQKYAENEISLRGKTASYIGTPEYLMSSHKAKAGREIGGPGEDRLSRDDWEDKQRESKQNPGKQ